MNKNTNLMHGKGENDNSHGNTRLPFGLCKKFGILLPCNATPKMAWEALKKKTGISSENFYNLLKEKNKLTDRTNIERELRNYKEIVLDDTLKEMPDKLFIANAKRLIKLDKIFNVLTKGFILKMNFLEENTSVSVNVFSGECDSLTFGSSYLKSLKEFIIDEKDSIKNKYSMEVNDDKLNVATLTHEYGHIFFAKILGTKNSGKRLSAQFEELKSKKISEEEIKKELWISYQSHCQEIVNEICEKAKKYNPNFNCFHDMSIYGLTTPAEWLAEAFCNAYGGKQNDIGKATKEYIEEIMKHVK